VPHPTAMAVHHVQLDALHRYRAAFISDLQLGTKDWEAEQCLDLCADGIELCTVAAKTPSGGFDIICWMPTSRSIGANQARAA